jgi:hypothetical protein
LTSYKPPLVEDLINSNTKNFSENFSIYDLEDNLNPNKLMEESEKLFSDPLRAQTPPVRPLKPKPYRPIQAIFDPLFPKPPPRPEAPITSAITRGPSSPSNPVGAPS